MATRKIIYGWIKATGLIWATLLISKVHSQVPLEDELEILQIVRTFEEESSILETEGRVKSQRFQVEAIRKLAALQSECVRDGMLDQAVAIQQTIQVIRQQAFGKWIASFEAKQSPFPQGHPLHQVASAPAPQNKEQSKLPKAALDIREAYDQNMAEIKSGTISGIKELGKRSSGPLRELLQSYRQNSKLNSAVMARDAIRLVLYGYIKPLPDPGAFSPSQDQVGKVLFFEVLAHQGGAVYGTDIYCSGSHVGACAIHAGVSLPNVKSIVKVTVLPGQSSYTGSVRNGIHSSSYGPYQMSFKVEAVDAEDAMP